MALSKTEIYALISDNLQDNTQRLTTNQKIREVVTQITAAMAVSVSEVELLRAASFVDQEPTGLDTPRKVEFGSSQNSASDKVMLNSNGNITFNQAGSYPVRIKLQAGRDGVSGESNLWLRILLNGVQIGVSAATIIDSAKFTFPAESRVVITADTGDVLTVEVMRDSAGVNEGKLIASTSSVAGWVGAPSALIVVSNYEVV